MTKLILQQNSINCSARMYCIKKSYTVCTLTQNVSVWLFTIQRNLCKIEIFCIQSGFSLYWAEIFTSSPLVMHETNIRCALCIESSKSLTIFERCNVFDISVYPSFDQIHKDGKLCNCASHVASSRTEGQCQCQKFKPILSYEYWIVLTIQLDSINGQYWIE